MSGSIDPTSMTDRDFADLSWIDLRLIMNQHLKVYLRNVEPEKVAALRMHMNLRIKITYFPNGTLVVSCPLSNEHEVVQTSLQGGLSDFNRANGGGNSFPVSANGGATVPFQAHYSGEPDLSLKIWERPSVNVIGLVNYRATRDVYSFIDEAVGYIRFTTSVMSVLMVWIEEIDPINKVYGLVLCEARRIVPAQGQAIPAGARNYMFRPSISFGNSALSANLATTWQRATSNLSVFPDNVPPNGAGPAPPGLPSSSGLPQEPSPFDLKVQSVPYALFPTGIVGVGFGGPACNRMTALPPQDYYRYRIPANLILNLDNEGTVLFNGIAAGAGVDYFVDLYEVQLNLVRVFV